MELISLFAIIFGSIAIVLALVTVIISILFIIKIKKAVRDMVEVIERRY